MYVMKCRRFAVPLAILLLLIAMPATVAAHPGDADEPVEHQQDNDPDDGADQPRGVDDEIDQIERELDAIDDDDDAPDRPVDDGDDRSVDDVDAELEQLERELDAVDDDEAAADPLDVELPTPAAPRESAPQSMNPDISAITDLAFAYFSDDPDLRGGHDPVNQGFNLQGVEVALQAAVDPYFRFDSYIVFSLYGVEVEEAYGTSLNLPANLQLRAGNYLTNFGRTNPTHLHVWDFTTQPLVLGKFFGGEGLRGLGVELNQMLPLPWFAEWSVSVQNIGGAATGRSWLGGPGDVDRLTDLGVTPRLEQYWDLTRDLSMLLGFSGTFGPNDTGRGNRTDVYGADLLLHYNPPGLGGHQQIGVQNEFMLRRRQVPEGGNTTEGGVLQDFGGYSELYYSPNLFWRFAGRYEFVSGVENDYLDPEWDDNRHRVAANITYYPSHFSRIRLEHGVDYMPYRDELDPLVHMTMVQLELVIGAHGAHQF